MGNLPEGFTFPVRMSVIQLPTSCPGWKPGSQYDISGEENRHIRLSFLNLSDDKIEVGLKRIGDMIRAMLEEKFLTLP